MTILIVALLSRMNQRRLVRVMSINLSNDPNWDDSVDYNGANDPGDGADPE